MNLKIRTGQLADIPVIADYQIKMAFETENGLQLDPGTVHKGVTAVIKDAHKGEYWIAEMGGKIAGCLLTVPEWSDWRNGTVLWIHSVYVPPEYRKHGIYKELYGFLKKKVEDSSDLRGLRLYVDKSNMRAQQVYEKLGMSREHYHMFEWMK